MQKLFVIAAFCLVAVLMVSLWAGTHQLSVKQNVTTGQARH